MKKPKIKKGSRIMIKGQPGRGIVADRIDNVCLVYRDDVLYAQIVHIKGLIRV